MGHNAARRAIASLAIGGLAVAATTGAALPVHAAGGGHAAMSESALGNRDGAPIAARLAANDRARVANGDPRTVGRLLAYDRRGAGRIVEVMGNLATARRIAVIVPGMGWNAGRVLEERNTNPDGPVMGAVALADRMRHDAPGLPTAVVMWLGYHPPTGIDVDVMRSARAAAGADRLIRFLRGLPGRARLTLVCHSYGAVVCGRAASRLPHRVGDLVALAAPGMDVRTAAGLRTTARVWTARANDDPIRFTPFVRVGGFGHGTDPTSARFGAVVMRTGSATGHSHYFRPGTESLNNVARIAAGHRAEVTRVADAS
jgi:pimeloyl-ACP methyl ester carboxylesterase